MNENRIKNIVIVGGGTAGWMAAAALSRLLHDKKTNIQLIESEQIGTVGVGEATIPQIQMFNTMLGLDENDFLKKTNGTFKLGIEFVNWGKIGDSYIHPFGQYGVNMEGIHFHHFWLKHLKAGGTSSIDDYCLQIKAAEQNKFMRPENIAGSPLASINYAFHFDATLYAQYLRSYAEKRGVTRREGMIKGAKKDAETGFIESVVMDDQSQIEGDLFIDCSGFRGLLIEQELKTGYDDWSTHLPCNRAVAMGTSKIEDPIPYTRATAKSAGWQWRIPLQHRTGNGYVYASDFISDEDAFNSMAQDTTGNKLSEPNFLRFVTGKRKKFWNKNVIALGLAAGFMEPLESTSIHLVQSGLSRLMSVFPDKNFNQADIDHYNSRVNFEYEAIRDFLILHYKATSRDDSDFWNYCRTMAVPDSLQEKLDFYRENARIYRHDNELFNETSWFSVMNGQNITPKRYHPLADLLPDQELNNRLFELKSVVANSVDHMPKHQDFINKNCADKP